jgi:hypothetical protein
MAKDRKVKLTLSNVEAAYIAGIIDGEGSLSLLRPKIDGCQHVYPSLQVANTNFELIDWLHKRLPFGVCVRQTLPKTSRERPVKWISWRAYATIAILKRVLRYLVVKRERALLVLEFWAMNKKAVKANGGKQFCYYRPVPDWLAAKRIKYAERLVEMNGKWRKDTIYHPKHPLHFRMKEAKEALATRDNKRTRISTQRLDHV